MATWDKDTIFIQLVTPSTGSNDETAHTVEFCPVDNTYPAGAVTGTQCSSEPSRYYPGADLDDETHYDIYVDGSCIGRLPAKKSYPAIGV
ncbi:MAG TPA: hypothetical protein PKZ83_17720 [bacterium]|nr:hypothetical protein [bacterium]HQJ66552.1 hypothetical protein [bacterium]